MNAPQEITRLERAERQSHVVRALQAALPADALLWNNEDTTPYECDGLTAYRQRPLVVALPRDRKPGSGRAADLPFARRAGRGSRRGHGPVRWRHAARAGRHAVARQVQPHPQGRSGQPHRRRAVRRAQSGHQRGGGAARPVLRAGPFQPDRLHHRRQRRRKLGRCALPEVRPDAAQRAQGAGLHGGRRAGGIRQRGAGLRGLRPAERHHWQRRHARGGDRGDRQAGPQAAAGALHHGQLRRRAQGGRCRRRGDRGGHHPGRPGDDGQAHDGRRRRLRACRLRPDGRGHPAVRERRHAGRSGRRDRAA